MDIAEWATGVVEGAAGALSPTAGDEEEEEDPFENGGELDLTQCKLVIPPVKKEEEKEHEPKWVRFVKSFDGYGDSEEKYEPTSHPKTVAGGVIFLIFRVIFLLLIIWSIVDLASLNQIVIPGDQVTLNVNQNRKMVPEGSNPIMDVPTLELRIDNAITFYEEKYPTLQSIEVLDLTGYNPRYLSDLKDVPVARAMYEKQTLDLNSWDEATQVVKSPEDPTISDLYSATVDDALHTFSESLKVFYKEGRVMGEVEEFYNHTTYLFVRIPASQLADIKMCQLQIAMYNKGVFEALKATEALDERQYHTPTLFPSLVTNPATWQPKYFTMNTVLDDWAFSQPENTLFVLKTRFTDDQLHKFVKSQAWGPLAVNISNVADLQYSYTPGGIHADDFLNYEYSISYVNNMKFTFEKMNCDGKKFFDSKYVVAYPVNETQTFVLLNTTVKPDFNNMTLPFEILVSTSVDQEQMIVTGFGKDAATGKVKLLVDRGENEATKDLRWYGGPFECELTTFPEFAPDDWSCDPALYWAEDGCHCDCGAYDPDCCLELESDVFNCKYGEVCSLKGNCVNTVIEDTGKAYVSEACESIYYAGEVQLVGYIGTDEQFLADTDGICQACMDDEFYDGIPQLTFESTFVCEIETTGYVSGQLNYDAIRSENMSSSTIELTVYTETNPFPEKAFPYLVKVADNFGLEEVLYVKNATTIREDYQRLVLTDGKGQRPSSRFVSFAQLWSACTTDSQTVVVQLHPKTTNFSSYSFSDNGPYQVRIADRSIIIADSSEVTFGDMQVLKLGQTIDFEFGFITRLVKPASRGDRVIYVEPFEWWYDSKVKNLTFPQSFPLTIRGEEGSFRGIDLLYSSNYSDPSWRCDPMWYNQNDGCHCNCGSVDPDCVYPTPASFTGKVYQADDLICATEPSKCPTCSYCSYPSSEPRCTTTAPTHTSFVTINVSDFMQAIYLASPLIYDHVAGQKVETPISIPADPADGFRAFNDSIFDVYSWLSIKRLLDTDEFKPSERWLPHTPELTTSPDPLEVEVAMFMVPDRNDFDHVKLCPGTNILTSEIDPIFDTNGWDKWETDDDINIVGCKWTKLTADSCYTLGDLRKDYPDQFNKKCIKDMPPSHRFDYTTRLPVNNKWSWKTGGDTLTNLPEYLLDVNHIYRFGYDNDYNSVEDEFATSATPGGDVDSNNTVHRFFGEISNRGLSMGDQYVAANVPYLSNKFSFVPSPSAVDDVLRYAPKGWPSERSDVRELIEQGLGDMVVEFDFDQLGGSTEDQNVPLEPGYGYFLTAEVTFEPVYRQSIWGPLFGYPSYKKLNFRIETTNVQKTALDWFSRQQCEVRYTVKISSSIKQVILAYETDIKTFIDSLGSAAGIVGAGVFLLSLIHYVTCQVREQRHKKAQEEQDKVVRAVLTSIYRSMKKQEKAQAKAIREKVLAAVAVASITGAGGESAVENPLLAVQQQKEDLPANDMDESVSPVRAPDGPPAERHVRLFAVPSSRRVAPVVTTEGQGGEGQAGLHVDVAPASEATQDS